MDRLMDGSFGYFRRRAKLSVFEEEDSVGEKFGLGLFFQRSVWKGLGVTMW